MDGKEQEAEKGEEIGKGEGGERKGRNKGGRRNE